MDAMKLITDGIIISLVIAILYYKRYYTEYAVYKYIKYIVLYMKLSLCLNIKI